MGDKKMFYTAAPNSDNKSRVNRRFRVGFRGHTPTSFVAKYEAVYPKG